MMSDVQLARVLGLVSLALGGTELASGRRLADELGVEKPAILEAFGAREIGTGLLAIAYPDNPWPIWGRVGGDVLDLALLSSAMSSGNRQRHNAAWAMLAVVGITLIDVACATMLTRRLQRARTTGRRTQLRRKLGTPLPKSA